MTGTKARELAIRISQFYENDDPWSYADVLADFDNNEELVLECTTAQLVDCPELVIEYLLDTLENMED